jgi:hypothetical protein
MAKKPKRPKRSSSVAVWERYDKRIREYEHNKKRKEALIKKHHA